VELPNAEPNPEPTLPLELPNAGDATDATGVVVLVAVDNVELPKAPPNPLVAALFVVDAVGAPNAEEVVKAGEEADEELEEVVLVEEDPNTPEAETGAPTALVEVLPKPVIVDVDEAATGAATGVDAVGAATGVDAVGATTGVVTVGVATGVDAFAKKLVNPKLDAAPPAKVGAAVGKGIKKIGCPN